MRPLYGTVPDASSFHFYLRSSRVYMRSASIELVVHMGVPHPGCIPLLVWVVAYALKAERRDEEIRQPIFTDALLLHCPTLPPPPIILPCGHFCDISRVAGSPEFG